MFEVNTVKQIGREKSSNKLMFMFVYIKLNYVKGPYKYNFF